MPPDITDTDGALALLAKSSLPFALVDAAGCVGHASRGFYEASGLSAGAELPPELAAAVSTDLDGEGVLELKDRRLCVQTIRGESCRLLVVLDRTEVAQLEEKMWEQQARLSKVYADLSIKNHALNSALDQLRQREEELRSVNHDLEAKVAAQLEQLERSERLRRYLSPEVANAILAQEAPLLSTRKRTLTVLFADIAGFEEIVADFESEEIIDILNEYRDEAAEVLFSHGATLDKFMSSRVMAFFGDPVPYLDHVERAVEAGLKLRELITRRAQHWFHIDTSVTVGIHTGYVTVGTVGSRHHADYTVIGKNVTLAGALQQEARSGQVIVSSKVHDVLKDRYLYEGMQSTLRGASRPVSVYNVIGAAGSDMTQNLPAPSRSSQRPAPATPEKQLGPYVLKERLGCGGMGAVYKAFDPRLQRTVAIKILLDSLCRDETVVNRFIREARALASLSSPHVPQVYYISDKERPPFFAMELIEGQTLEQLLHAQKALPCSRAVELAAQIAAGLQAAYEKNIIHRDIKPANLMLTSHGQIKLLDFGIMKSEHDDGLRTAQGAIMGTPMYMAPEQALGASVDHRADIYALGATLYHMLVGAPPFQGPNNLSLLRMHEEEPLPPLSQLPRPIPPQVYQLIQRMMAKRPEERYPSYAAVLDALATLQRAAA